MTTSSESHFEQLIPGDPMPVFKPRTAEFERFSWDTLAGRYIVFCFFGTAGDEAGRAAIEALRRHRALFDDDRFTVFGVSVDPSDEAQARVADALPGMRFAWDFDLAASKLCGAVPTNSPAGQMPFRRFWLVVDPTLHVLSRFDFPPDHDHEAFFAGLKTLPHPQKFAGFEIPAPILVVPNVFEPGLCRHLIGLYDAETREESGVMRNNVGVIDAGFKRRRDYHLTDPALMREVQLRIWRRVVPEIRKLFGMEITRMERYLVGCYAAEDGGHFGPHRDNNQLITEHRRFAVSINLNDAFEGGAVSFPEYNTRGYKALPGWAIVFPGAALHAVSRVSSGRRYAFLPFVYDEVGAEIRARNMDQLSLTA